MTFQAIYARDLDRTLREQNALLIDLRTAEEYRAGHWPGAINFEYEKMQNWKGRLPKNRLLLFYCTHGGNSMKAARSLAQEGYLTGSVFGGYDAMQKIR